MNTYNHVNRERASSQLIFKDPHDNLSILCALKKKAEFYMQNRLKTKVRQFSLDHLANTEFPSTEEEDNNYFFQKMKQIQRSSGQFHQFVFDYLQKYKSFYSMIQNEFEHKRNEVLKKLCTQFKVNYYQKHKVVFYYGEPSDKYYLICQGKVDLLFPYYEKIRMTAESMILYLLRLKRYNETEMLVKVIEMNNQLFIFGDKKFDIWITAASNTLLKIQDNMYHKEKYTQLDTSKEGKSINDQTKDNNESTVIQKSSLMKFKKLKQYNKNQHDENEAPIPLVSYAKNTKFIQKIERELIDIIRVINDKQNTYSSLINEVSSSDYITRLLPSKISIEDKRKTKEAIIMKYHLNNSLNKESQFGEIVFEANENKMSSFPLPRLCTAITTEDSQLGHFEKKIYLDSIRSAYDKSNKAKVDNLKGFRLFLKTKTNQIIKNYSSFFSEVELEHDEFIIKEGENINDNQKVYFIKEGEFEVYCNKTIIELDQILTNLGNGEQIQDKIRTNPIPETDEYFAIMNIKNKLRLSYFRYNDVVGLEDCYYNNHYLYSVQCKSKKGKAYDINTKLLEYIIAIDEEIKKSSVALVNSKQKLLIEILFKQRDIKLGFSYLFNKDNAMKSNSRIDLDIFKKQISVPYVPRLQSHMNYKDNDIDLTLINSSSKVSLAENRRKKTLLFLKQYHTNLEQSKGKTKQISLCYLEKKIIESTSKKTIVEFSYTDKPKLNKTQSEIDPLVYDNFNRLYNTSLYYPNFFSKQEQKKYNIKLIVPQSKTNCKRKSRSCINFNARNRDTSKKRSDRDVTQSIINRKLRMIYDSKKYILSHRIMNKN